METEVVSGGRRKQLREERRDNSSLAPPGLLELDHAFHELRLGFAAAPLVATIHRPFGTVLLPRLAGEDTGGGYSIYVFFKSRT